MSGLAASIRLAMYDRKVLLLERHNAAGGLNSFYKMGGYHFDVGLHALTNYVPEGKKGTPLGKIFRQLRIKREQFDLCEQTHSNICFPDVKLHFNNNFEYFRGNVIQNFPHEADNFNRFVEFVKDYHAVSLNPDSNSARAEIRNFIKDPLLIEMLLCPLLYYGSARENDMDFGQFVVLFQAIFLEGFSRPYDGVRPIVRTLLRRAKESGVERKMGLGVKELKTDGIKIAALELDNGEVITADHVVSTIGSNETNRICSTNKEVCNDQNIGRLSFTESIAVLDCEPKSLGFEDTIVFFNTAETIHYERPQDLIDYRSGVICVPNNYNYGDRELEHGILRITAQANYPKWKALDATTYTEAKEKGYRELLKTAVSVTPGADIEKLESAILFKDMFTPTTITRYTGHLAGAVYGAPQKVKDGCTEFENLYLCGTDQGFLGVIGSMLSGISIVNYHILKGS
jgi:phytoene dehydrogenase-like protein